jgi:hypothetical protein
LAALTAIAGVSRRTKVLSRRVKWAAAMIAAACLIAFLGFLAGEHHQRPATTVLTGIATVGDREATVLVGGRAYGIEGTVTWVDQDGMTHYGSWPACLGGPGRTALVTFGEVPVTTPDGATVSQVVWVDCRS